MTRSNEEKLQEKLQKIKRKMKGGGQVRAVVSGVAPQSHQDCNPKNRKTTGGSTLPPSWGLAHFFASCPVLLSPPVASMHRSPAIATVVDYSLQGNISFVGILTSAAAASNVSMKSSRQIGHLLRKSCTWCCCETSVAEDAFRPLRRGAAAASLLCLFLEALYCDRSSFLIRTVGFL